MSKSTKILIGAVVLLIAIYGIQRLTSSNSTTLTINPFAKLDTAQVDKISIDFDKDISMKRISGAWMITSPVDGPASPNQVSMFLARLASNPSAAVVADNLSDSSAYGLMSNAPRLDITTQSGRQLAFRLGNITPDFNGCYMQMTGDNRVLELSTNIRSLAGQSLTDWRDKVIFGIQVSDVAAADFSVGDTLYHFFHSDTLWKVNNVTVPTSTAQEIIESLTGTRAVGFVDTSTHLSKRFLDYGITLKNKEHFAGTLFKTSDQVCLTNSATDQTFVVSSMLPQTLDQELRSLHRTYLTKLRS